MAKWLKIFLVAVLVLIVFFVLFVAYQQRRPADVTPVRALWVTRFDYDSVEDVRAIIDNVGRAGFTDVFFQIRGNATVYFKSQLEPWAYELSGGDVSMLGTDPGWDPLQTAIDQADPYRLRVHAYMNVLPGWKGLKDPPAAADQLWTAHPDWFMVDSLQQKMLPTPGWYAFVNPVLPEVREHLRGLVKELCRYDVDGIHLDYIRYPHDYFLEARHRYPDASEEELRRHADFSYDPASQHALMEQYGWDVSKAQISAFRCESVTRVVRDIRYTMQVGAGKDRVLSASVMGDPVSGKAHAYQDSGAWVQRSLVDWVVQMNYGTKSFDQYLQSMEQAAGRRKFESGVVVGLYCKNDSAELLEQLEHVQASGCRGFALFSYSFLFDDAHRTTEKGRILLEKIRP